MAIMDRERIDAWLERGLLVLVLGALAFGVLATGATRVQDFAVVQALVGVATLVWVVRFWVNPSHRLQWPPACWAVLAFAIYALVRYRQADVEYVARLEWLRVLIYAWLFFLVLNNLHRQETTQWLLGVLLGVGTLVAMYGVYQALTNARTIWHFPKPTEFAGRASGTFICPNHLAGFLEMLLPIALAHLFLSRSKAVSRVLYGYAALVMLAGIAVTVSRGGYLVTALGLAVFFGWLLRKPGYRRAALVTVVVVGLGAYLFLKYSEQGQKRFRRALEPGQLQDVRIRPNLWVPAWRMWQDHVWLGVGPAHFDVRFPAYRPVSVQTRPVYVHNDYLNALVDWGVIGGLIILAFLGCVVAGAIKTWKYVHRSPNDLTTRRSDRSAAVLGMSVGILCLLAHSVVDFNLQVPGNAMVALALLASLTSHLRFATGDYWVSPRILGRVAVTVVGLMTVGYLAPLVQQQFREGRWLLAADTARTGSVQLAALNAAHAVEPRNAETAGKIGEIHRLISWEGGDTWAQSIEEALRWFELAMKLNRFETYYPSRYGMALDWQRRHDEATPYFDRALALDPNNYFLAMLRGWHEIQRGDDAAAKKWLQRSLEIKWYDNQLANNYLKLVNERLARKARGS